MKQMHKIVIIAVLGLFCLAMIQTSRATDYFDYWVHGVAIIVEYPTSDEIIRSQPEIQSVAIETRRPAWGTEVYQTTGYNWFHFAVPTPTQLEDEMSFYTDAWILADIEDNAKITKVSVHHGSKGIKKFEGLSLIGQHVFEKFDLPDGKCTQPMVVSVRVDFDGKTKNKVVFYGAGIRFDERQ